MPASEKQILQSGDQRICHYNHRLDSKKSNPSHPVAKPPIQRFLIKLRVLFRKAVDVTRGNSSNKTSVRSSRDRSTTPGG